MGNCFVMERKVIKIVRNDGKVLEYREPINVHHILTQFSGHSLFDNTTKTNTGHQHHHLLPHVKLLSGRHYYLLPTTTITNKKKIKKVTFADPEVEDAERLLSEEVDHDDTGESKSNRDDSTTVSVVRMKIVVHKQELEKLLQGGSVHEMVYQSLEKQRFLTDDDDDLDCNRGWRPVLGCIPESDQ
ncbi:unnamed protein product [Microthlaspi erraticum]|uniref:Uncharacterized protein n=1 Tax=Microthlaspi erraticum TaxID=1685480 RepID=A0A6D2IZA5_9BRAS|nr:unnamed protein product [Microthlaspi erraticum]